MDTRDDHTGRLVARNRFSCQRLSPTITVVTIGGVRSRGDRRCCWWALSLVLIVRDKHISHEVGLAATCSLLGWARLHLCAASDYMRYGGDLAAMDKLNAACAAELAARRRPCRPS